VTNVGNDRSQLASVAKRTKDTLETETLGVVADRGYFNSAEILACEEAGITVTLPKPMTSGAKSEGRFGKQDFRYVAEENVYICPAGERLAHHFTNEEHGLVLHRYWTNTCQSCHIKNSCTTSKERRIRVGSMSRFSRPFSAGSTSIRKKCASGVRRSSILSERSRPGWEQPTS
jgi:hypothetical protein